MGKGDCGTCCDDEDDYDSGRKHDPNFRGPIEERSCTDVICCVIFTVCVLLLILVALVAFARGDYRRVIYPTNSDGHVCGTDILNRTKLVFFDLTVCARMGIAVMQLGCPTPQVCVSACPNTFWTWVAAHMKETGYDMNSDKFTINQKERRQMVCLKGNHGAEGGNERLSIKELVENDICAPYVLPSTSMLGRCMPRIIEEAGDKLISAMKVEMSNRTVMSKNETLKFEQVFNGTISVANIIKVYGTLQTLFEDLIESWPYLVIGFVISVAVCLLWVVLLRLIAKVMVIVSIIGFVLLFAGITILAAYKYWKIKGTSEAMYRKFKLTLDFGYYFQLYSTWLVIAITFGSVLLIVVLLLIWLRKRISIAIAIIEETSKSVAHMTTSLFFPLIPFLLQLGVLVFFLVTAIYISSMGKPELREIDSKELMSLNLNSRSVEEAQNIVAKLLNKYTPCDPDRNGTLGKLCRFVKYGDDGYSTVLQVYNLFMFFWLFNFVDALCQMTLAGGFASYYFALNKPADVPAFPLVASLYRCIRYHLGSIAFGSLILSIVQLIRVMLEYLDQKLKGNENPVAEFLLKCLKCCFWCLEKCLKFFNRNAYIMIAIYGRNFCSAGRDAFFLILRNVVRVAVVDKVADFVLFISKLVIIAIIAPSFYLFFNGTLAAKISLLEPLTPRGMSYHLVPVILIVGFTYFCACLFLSVYDMGVDTLFLCFLEDLERNDGSAERPYYMPASLKEILGKKNDPLLEKRDAEGDKVEAEAAV